jgi:transposase InsO family protein
MGKRGVRTTRTSCVNLWRAGCGESRTSGSEGGPEKPTNGNAGRALRSDPYTYIATWEGWGYLATVIDLASRRVVGWALADHMRTDLVADALRMACVHRRPPAGVIFHSDRGCQYTSGDFAELAATLGVTLSLGRKGQCWDNAVSESWFSSFKNELIDTRAWPTIAGLHRAVFDYIEGWYNVRRLHSTLGYQSPAAYEAAIHHNAVREAA